MNAQQAKEITFGVRPLKPPPPYIFHLIANAASNGKRECAINSSIDEEEEWWLLESGYSVVTIDSVRASEPRIVVKIQW